MVISSGGHSGKAAAATDYAVRKCFSVLGQFPPGTAVACAAVAPVNSFSGWSHLIACLSAGTDQSLSFQPELLRRALLAEASLDEVFRRLQRAARHALLIAISPPCERFPTSLFGAARDSAAGCPKGGWKAPLAPAYAKAMPAHATWLHAVRRALCARRRATCGLLTACALFRRLPCSVRALAATTPRWRRLTRPNRGSARRRAAHQRRWRRCPDLPSGGLACSPRRAPAGRQVRRCCARCR